MSYDISLYINTGMEEACVCDIGNITYNIGAMVDKACGMTFTQMDGKSALEVADILKKGIVAMLESPEEYEALNPSNRWGSFKDLLPFMENFWSRCREHPACIVSVS